MAFERCPSLLGATCWVCARNATNAILATPASERSQPGRCRPRPTFTEFLRPMPYLWATLSRLRPMGARLLRSSSAAFVE